MASGYILLSLVTELQERVKRPGVGCSECGGRGGAKEVKLTSPPPPPIIVLLVVPTWTLVVLAAIMLSLTLANRASNKLRED